jgi:hypothetical protein
MNNVLSEHLLMPFGIAPGIFSQTILVYHKMISMLSGMAQIFNSTNHNIENTRSALVGGLTQNGVVLEATREGRTDGLELEL